MLMGRLPIKSIMAVLALGLTAPAAQAELSAMHVNVALKSIKFLQPAPQAGDVAAFVYKDGDAASKSVAEQLAGGMDTSVLAARVTSSSAPDLSKARLVFVTDAALADIAGINAVAQPNHAAAVASQTSCSEAGECVLTVETEPKVQIYLSAAAAGKAGVSFSNAFMMLVKKH